MMKNTELSKEEELSRCLDSLNENRHPSAGDEEIKELVDLAVFVKQSYKQEELPRVLINEIVDNLANEFQAKKQKKSHYWLYSGLTGIAAAVVIAAFAQFLLPQSADYNIARQTDDKIEAQKIADQSIILESANTISSQQAQLRDNKAAPVAVAIEEKSTSSAAKVLAKIIPAAESSNIEEKDKQVAMLQEQSPNDMAMQKNVAMNKTSSNSAQQDKSIQGRTIARAMVIPNQATQSIKRDAASGNIKHIYNIGTHDEIIITQARFDESKITSTDTSKEGEVQALTQSQAIQPSAKKVNDTMNSLTVKMDQYNIVIEGKKPPEELQKIAESLVEKEIEE